MRAALLLVAVALAGCTADVEPPAPKHTPGELAALRDALEVPPGGHVENENAWTTPSIWGSAVLAFRTLSYPAETDAAELARAVERSAAKQGWVVESTLAPEAPASPCYSFFATKGDIKLVATGQPMVSLATDPGKVPSLAISVMESAANAPDCAP